MNLQPKQGTHIHSSLTATPFEDFLERGRKRLLSNREFCGYTISDVAIHFSEQQDGGLLDALVKFVLTSDSNDNATIKLTAFQAFAASAFDKFINEHRDEFWSHFECVMQRENDESELFQMGY